MLIIIVLVMSITAICSIAADAIVEWKGEI